MHEGPLVFNLTMLSESLPADMTTGMRPYRRVDEVMLFIPPPGSWKVV